MKSPLARTQEVPHPRDALPQQPPWPDANQADGAAFDRAPVLNALMRECHFTAMHNRFWERINTNDEDVVLSQKLQLVSDELTEAHEVIRSGFDMMFKQHIEDADPEDADVIHVEKKNPKNGLPHLREELCDAVIRLFDILGYLDERNLHIPNPNDMRDDRTSAEVMLEKMGINAGRPPLHGRRF